MAIEIPLLVDSPSYSQHVTLEGVVYTFEFRWNVRAGSWYMNLLTAEEDPIVMSVKVVPGFPLAWTSKDPRRPPGNLVVVDTSGADLPPGEHELGGRVQIVYFTPDEVAAAAAAV
jgi:hypothetical protein